MGYRGEIIALWIFSFIFVIVAVFNQYGLLDLVKPGFMTGYNIYSLGESSSSFFMNEISFLFVGAFFVVFVTIIIVYLIYKNYEARVDDEFYEI